MSDYKMINMNDPKFDNAIKALFDSAASTKKTVVVDRLFIDQLGQELRFDYEEVTPSRQQLAARLLGYLANEILEPGDTITFSDLPEEANLSEEFE